MPPGLTATQAILGCYTTTGWSVNANALKLVACGGVTASDTDYWTLAIGYATSASPTVVLTITTKTVSAGGTGDLVGGTVYSLTHSGFSVPVNGFAFVNAAPTGSPETSGKLFVFVRA